MHTFFTASVSLLSLFLALAHAQSPFSIPVRLAPTRDPSSTNRTSFRVPPPSYFYGTWHVSHSSNKAYSVLLNMRFESYPILPTCTGSTSGSCPPGTFPGQLVDLTSYSDPANTSEALTAFGYDTPRRAKDPSLGPEWAGVNDFRGTGRMAQAANSWIVVGYGTDERGDDFIALYETPVPASGFKEELTIESRRRGGPSFLAFERLKAGLRALGDEQMAALVGGLQVVRSDEARDGQGPVVCGEECQVNEGFVGVPEGGARLRARR